MRADGFSAWLDPRGVTFSAAGTTLRMEFAGASFAVRLEGDRRLAAAVNLIHGSDPSAWQTGLPAYEGVLYRGIYPGIDYRVTQEGGRFKSEFLVAPGADPAAIRLQYGGRLSIQANGDLVAENKGRRWREHAPVVYQPDSTGRSLVAARFVLLGSHTVGFDLGPRNPRTPLVIDPTLTFSTLLGSTGSASATAIARDADGAVYVAGYTDGFNFPAQGVGFARGGGVDAVVSKIDPHTSQLLYSTYLGGSGDDRAYGLAVDSSGFIYVAGATTSANFPVSSAWQGSIRGYKDAFLLKLNPSNGVLAFSTYFGGAGSDTAKSVAISPSGYLYIAGDTDSSDLPTPAGYRRTPNGAVDAFVARFTSSGQLDTATYYGGAADDYGRALALDPSGYVWLGGSTQSPGLPTVAPYQSTLRGSMDGFLARFDAPLSTLLSGTFFGGTQGTVAVPEEVLALAADSTGAVYASGVTPSSDFPVLAPVQALFSGESDAWVAKFNSSGSLLLFSTFLGGSNYDSATALALEPGGRVHVAGQTYSSNFPTNRPTQPAHGGWIDAFLASLDGSTGALLYSTFLGGTSADGAAALASGSSGAVYIAGTTSSAEFPQYNPIQMLTGAAMRLFLTEINVSDLDGTARYSLTSTASPGAGGSIVRNPASADGLYNVGTVVQLTASPSPGYSFQGWSGDASGSSPSTSVTMSAARAVTASFVATPPPDLSLSKVHSGSFIVGGTGVYTLSVSNVGGLPATGTITLTDSLPAGLTFLAATGIGWSCSAAGQNVACTNPGPLNAGAATGVTLTVSVGASAYPSVSNTASVSNSSDANTLNNTVSDPTAVAQPSASPSLPSGPLMFVAIPPCRLMDTREGKGFSGPHGPPVLQPGDAGVRTVPATGRCGIPAAAQAFSANLTVVPEGGPVYYITLYPNGMARPVVSSVNDPQGVIVANAAIVPIGNGGAFQVYVTNSTHLVIDLNGYFAPAASFSPTGVGGASAVIQ